MSTLPGLICLVVYILARPFDFVPALRAVPFLYIFFCLAVLGFVFDITQRNVPWRPSPHLPWAITLILWALLTVAIRDVSALASCNTLLITFSLYFLTAHGIGDFRSFSTLAGVFLACTLMISAACVYQGLQPFTCVAFSVPYSRGQSPPSWVGGPCSDTAECLPDERDPTLDFQCEKVGLAGSVSVGHGRVAYGGMLADPNESALAVSIGVPIAIARYQQRRNVLRWLVLSVTLTLAAIAVVMSGSRGGLLAFVAAVGVYFLRRYRWKGVLLAALLVLPALMYGGREGAESEGSATERQGLLAVGVEMFLHSPIMGVGYDQFTGYFGHTAHNSYVLAPAELGVLGMTCWAMLVWISIKVVLKPSRSQSGDGDDSGIWGEAMLATMVSSSVGVFFLSFNFHYLLWMVFGLAGGYNNARLQSPTENTVRIGPKDVTLVAGANLALLIILRVYLRTKGF